MSEACEFPDLSAGLARMDRDALVALYADRETRIRQMQAQQAAVLAEIDARGVFAETGYGSLTSLQTDVVHISKKEAAKRAARAVAMHPGVGISGNPVEAVAPQAAAALADGAIGLEHVDQIHATMTEIPGDIPAEQAAEVEAALVELARKDTPQQVAKAGRHAVDLLHPDGERPDDDRARPERELRTGWRRDGRLGFQGILDKEAGHRFERLVSGLSKPQPAADGQRDPRTADERRGDAFADLLERTEQAADLPAEAGERPTVVVALDLQWLIDGIGAAGMIGDDPISASRARRIACDANVIPAVLNGQSEVLDHGQKRRLVSISQRRALTLRDKGCIKCGRPPQWCQAHHIQHWIDGGPTDLDNLCLLCSECHRLIHHSDWTITKHPHGKAECVPPDWIPTQRNRSTEIMMT